MEAQEVTFYSRKDLEAELEDVERRFQAAVGQNASLATKRAAFYAVDIFEHEGAEIALPSQEITAI